jgi:hypothetical protein
VGRQRPKKVTSVRRGGPRMNEKMLKNLDELVKSIEKNSETVREEMKKAGIPEPDPAIVTSAAKYYSALQLLARE